MNRLVKLKEKAEILNILLARSVSYWGFIKKILQFPLITSSSLLVVLNSYFKEDEEKMKLVNVVLNGTNVIIMALLNNLSITEKIENFNSKTLELVELVHSIENEMYGTNEDKVELFQEKFDYITKNILLDAIPSSVKNKVQKEYPHHSFPLIMGFLSNNNSPNGSLGGDEV